MSNTTSSAHQAQVHFLGFLIFLNFFLHILCVVQSLCMSKKSSFSGTEKKNYWSNGFSHTGGLKRVGHLLSYGVHTVHGAG